MKNLTSTIAATILMLSIFLPQQTIAQSPEKMSYQAVIRNSTDDLLTNTQVGMQISIVQGSPDGTVVYTETHTPTTNINGLVSIKIGGGAGFSDIDWGNGFYFIKTETDPTGGTDYAITGTSQLLSVPYALYAETSGNSGASSIDELSDGKSDADGSSLFIGVDAGLNNDETSVGNVGIGFNTLFSNTTGNENTATGFEALYNNTQGKNTATGFQSLYSNTTGVANSALGFESLYSNVNGFNNTGIGNGALYENIDGNWNTAVGAGSLRNNISGDMNTAVGVSALSSNTEGNENTALGRTALFSNLVGSENTAIGKSALYYNSSGSSNTAIGRSALQSNTTGNLNTANGTFALEYNTTGSSNTANGMSALRHNTTGSLNTANGLSALYDNTTGSENVANGSAALFYNTTGSHNVANGRYALYMNTTGSNNTANGKAALHFNTTGSSNTANGSAALYSKSTGDENTAIGCQALSNLNSGTNNIGIGYNAQSSSNTASNQVTIGNVSNNVYRMYASSWTNASDRKLKHAIKTIPVGLEFVLKLRPVEFVYNNANNEEITFGFIAQEVQEAVKQSYVGDGILVSPLSDEYLGLRTTELISVLTKAIQEQQEIIDNQSDEIEALTTKQKDTDERLNKMEALLNHTLEQTSTNSQAFND